MGKKAPIGGDKDYVKTMGLVLVSTTMTVQGICHLFELTTAHRTGAYLMGHQSREVTNR